MHRATPGGSHPEEHENSIPPVVGAIGKIVPRRRDGGCGRFTRPELVVERVTYPLPTPSAARGILEAILWKPEMLWQVREIWVLRPIRYIHWIRRERTHKATMESLRRRADGDVDATDPEGCTLRGTLALRDVAFST